MTPYDKLAASGGYPAGVPKQCKNWCRQQKIASCTDKQIVCARERQHSDAREIRLNRQWSAAALWCLLLCSMLGVMPKSCRFHSARNESLSESLCPQ